jgi:hypothetical protein
MATAGAAIIAIPGNRKVGCGLLLAAKGAAHGLGWIMPTPRTDAAPRILAAIGSEELTHHAIAMRTGLTVLSVKSAANAMRRRGELVRFHRDGIPMYRKPKREGC